MACNCWDDCEICGGVTDLCDCGDEGPSEDICSGCDLIKPVQEVQNGYFFCSQECHEKWLLEHGCEPHSNTQVRLEREAKAYRRVLVMLHNDLRTLSKHRVVINNVLREWQRFGYKEGE